MLNIRKFFAAPILFVGYVLLLVPIIILAVGGWIANEDHVTYTKNED